MRDIKFRAWDKRFKRIINWEYLEISRYDEFLSELIDRYSSIYELMQYTGINDKNGIRIYEGDIVVPGWQYGEVFEVVYNAGRCRFACKRRGSEYAESGEYIMDGSILSGWVLEVIGNIYENPELLKEQP